MSEGKKDDRIKLPFGANTSIYFDNIKNYADAFSAASPSLQKVDSIDAEGNKSQKFEASFSLIQANSLSLIASCSNPVKWSDDGPSDCWLEIPYYGKHSARINNQQYEWESSKSMMLFGPAQKIESVSDYRCLGLMKFPLVQLQETLATMMVCIDQKPITSQIEKSQLLPNQIRGSDFLVMYSNIFKTVDQCTENTDLINRLHLDDVVMRMLVYQVYPQYFMSEVTHKEIKKTKLQQIDVICDYIKANPNKWVSKTTMERLTGISGRAIQYSFQKRFSMSPMEWQKSEKLILARKLLSDPHNNYTITHISDSLAFSSPSVFTTDYKKMFAELPSDTRKINHSRKSAANVPKKIS